ncbi:MAG TPA: hypothetical protein VKG25_19780 [Bryobacteraceae bacterium]|nr:hypothetical protein [Bryobacteraceae bacterium]
MPPTRHLSIVANLFRAAGVCVGAPSLLFFLYSGWVWITLLAPSVATDTSGTGPKDGLVWLLTAGARVVGGLIDFGIRANQLARRHWSGHCPDFELIWR